MQCADVLDKEIVFMKASVLTSPIRFLWKLFSSGEKSLFPGTFRIFFVENDSGNSSGTSGIPGNRASGVFFLEVWWERQHTGFHKDVFYFFLMKRRQYTPFHKDKSLWKPVYWRSHHTFPYENQCTDVVAVFSRVYWKSQLEFWLRWVGEGDIGGWIDFNMPRHKSKARMTHLRRKHLRDMKTASPLTSPMTIPVHCWVWNETWHLDTKLQQLSLAFSLKTWERRGTSETIESGIFRWAWDDIFSSCEKPS